MVIIYDCFNWLRYVRRLIKTLRSMLLLLPLILLIIITSDFFDIWKVIEHKPYDHKADVFSFAIVLWELLTGKVMLSAFLFFILWLSLASVHRAPELSPLQLGLYL